MSDLTTDEIDRWRELRASNPELDSPYFHPGFSLAVAATRPGVRVVIGENERAEIASFLPVQQEKRSWRPAGSPAADFQGPVCAPTLDSDILAALRTCGVASYQFDHMRDGIVGLQPWIFSRQRSPYIDVSGGTDGYLSRASRSGKENLGQARRRTRKIEREYGSVRFIPESTDTTLLDAVIALKRRQYSATGSQDYFAHAHHVSLVHRLLDTRGLEFGGMLSAIYAGTHLVAAHFGLRSERVLHWWFPVYEPSFGQFAPGWVLLRALIEAAPELGIERIDLGRGDDEYKRRAMTGYQVVCQGAVIANPVRRRAAAARRTAVAAVKTSPAAPGIRSAVRYVRRWSR